jgi:hypothetical protein
MPGKQWRDCAASHNQVVVSHACHKQPPLAIDQHNHSPLQVAGRPAFLDPEATRPLAVCTTHGLTGGRGPAGGGQQQHKGKKGRGLAPGEEFDIARLAPPVKGQQQ